MSSTEPIRIKSYVILDLETTGLPSTQFKTKITELSILCVTRSSIIQTYETHRKDNFLPRVVNKLNLCIYPRKFIDVRASEISGLTNDLLEHCRHFDNDIFFSIQSVINIMEPPICILAHNGNRFDFPLLRSEIEHIGKALPKDIYCADTIIACRDLIPKNAIIECAFIDDFNYDVSELDRNVDISEDEDNAPEISEDEGDVLVPEISEDEDCLEPHVSTRRKKKVTRIDWGSNSLDCTLSLAAEEAERKYLENVKSINIEDIRKVNETTPKSRKLHFLPVKKRLLNDKTNARKQLFDSAKLCAPKSYQLKDMYNYLTGKVLLDAHQADSDTHALLECMVALGPSFLQWIDNNCSLFNDIKKLW